jgi:hypothetical protein
MASSCRSRLLLVASRAPNPLRALDAPQKYKNPLAARQARVAFGASGLFAVAMFLMSVQERPQKWKTTGC